MKKKILLYVSLILSIASFAQRIQFGIGAGVSSYSIQGAAAGNLNQVLNFSNGIVTTKAVNGFYTGGYANIPLINNISLEPGLYYSTKGYALSGKYTFKDINILSVNANAALKLSYVEIPLLLKAQFSGLQVFAGPQIAYLTRANIKTSAGLAGFNLLHSNMDATSQFNRWDVAMEGGIGYQFTNGIRLTAAYERGLTKVDAGQNIKSYNQGFKIGAGISF